MPLTSCVVLELDASGVVLDAVAVHDGVLLASLRDRLVLLPLIQQELEQRHSTVVACALLTQLPWVLNKARIFLP